MALSKRKAVALKYMDGIEAPIVLSKGEGWKADVIIEEAVKNGVPVTEDKVLVDMLGLSPEGNIVPENTWQALALIFSFILSESEKRRNGE